MLKHVYQQAKRVAEFSQGAVDDGFADRLQNMIELCYGPEARDSVFALDEKETSYPGENKLGTIPEGDPDWKVSEPDYAAMSLNSQAKDDAYLRKLAGLTK